MGDSEWEGEVHTLIVWDLGERDWLNQYHEIGEYEIEHPPSCKSEMTERFGEQVRFYHCGVGWNEDNGDLAFSFNYSGTPIKAPGTYRIRDWGRKHYVSDAWAYEYDAGLVVMEDAMTPAMRARLHAWRLSADA